ncbi:MAG TPA: alpha/beta hydrolase, partial [Pirellulales bacterium]|nr:alpha/beta hydrolase [Pirellulales bacterium]
PITLVVLSALLLTSFAALEAANPSKEAKQAAKAKKGDSPRLPSDLKIEQGIVYKQVGDQKLDMMLFLPLEKKFEKSPLVVYIHGGGWAGGDKYRVLKPQLLEVVRELNKQGVTCASIEYRLMKAGSVTVMDCAADCKDAVRFLVKHADEYGLDPQRIGTFGSSAGGHLTLVTALGADRDYACDPTLDGPPGKILCVASFYPLVSIIDPAMLEGRTAERNERMEQAMLGGTVKEKRDLALKLSPTELVRSDSPAILLAHGDQDEALTFHNATAMRDAAQAKGVPVECIISKGAGHSFSGQDIDPSIEEIDRRTVAFFIKYLCQQ